MTELTILNVQGVERQPIAVFSEKAYLDYSMSVILDRALPHLADGLKPVQRRIIYAMSELGLKAGSKFKKSARTVGDVLGKFHPHGDSACYEAMVLMAQDFSFRYPFVDGQGNWGSADDPKSFAAMRYTEARLSAYANALLSELEHGTVDWVPNFDATLQEPAMLPARLPNILLNGASGIAVGMATDIPPHNLHEVVQALVHLIENPKASLTDICQFIQGPDYPTQAEIITPRSEIQTMYQKGSGSIRQRAVYQQEGQDIVITALPHQTSGAKILEQIAQLMQAKKLPMVADLRDESDHENPTRLVITPRSNRVEVEALMAHLFATTDLERSYRVNLNMIGLDNRPRVKNLLTILTEWLEYRLETVRRRLQHRLDKVLDRLHILDGLLIAFLNIDEVIEVIRNEDQPKPALCARFKLTEQQAHAILELKLRHLAKLEEMKIRAEQESLADERKQLEQTLGSPRRMKTLVKKELLADAELFGDARRSPLVTREEAKAIKETDLLPTEPITLVLSKKGWARIAKGHEIDAEKLNYRAGDGLLTTALGKSNQQAIFIDSTGRSYSFPGHSLPSARGQGEPVTGRVKAPSGASFVGALIGEAEQQCVLACDNGYGFICGYADLHCKNRSGKVVIKPAGGACVLPPVAIVAGEASQIAMVTNEGRLLLFPVSELPQLTRGKGNKMINIPAKRAEAREEWVVAMTVLLEQQGLTLHAGKRHLNLKHKDLQSYCGERGRRGNKLPRGFQRVDAIEPMV